MEGKHRGAQSSIAAELEKARNELLDRTLRNKLLNFGTKSKSAIPVVEEVPREVYYRLVLEGKSMVFRAKPSRDRPTDLARSGQDDDRATAASNNVPEIEEATSTEDIENTEEQELWKLDDEQLGKQHTDKYLQTSLTENELGKRLFTIYHKANEVIEEQGYNVLYLALAFLEWKETETSDRSYLAPLILVPVSLKRHTAGKRYSLSWSQEEVFENISLAARLKSDFGIILPEFSTPDERTGVKSYLDQVAKAIRSKPNWRVRSDIWLGFFSFARFVMWRDLDGESWPDEQKPTQCDLLSLLFAKKESESVELDDGLSDEELAADLDIKNVFHVMDADASQVAVIELAKAGKNLVVEGPPGTGKSQTITNLIAELLGAGKRVLFVSEKMPALEVVHRRLKKCGLADPELNS